MMKLYDSAHIIADLNDRFQEENIKIRLVGGLAVQAYLLNCLQNRYPKFQSKKGAEKLLKNTRNTIDIDLDFADADIDKINDILFTFAEEENLIFEPSNETKRANGSIIYYGKLLPKMYNPNKDHLLDYSIVTREENKNNFKRDLTIYLDKPIVIPTVCAEYIIDDKLKRREEKDIVDINLIVNLFKAGCLKDKTLERLLLDNNLI